MVKKKICNTIFEYADYDLGTSSQFFYRPFRRKDPRQHASFAGCNEIPYDER